MGRFLTERDFPKPRSDYDRDYKERDWFVGDESRFVYGFRWFTEDRTYTKQTSSIPRIELRKWFENCCLGDILVVDSWCETKIHEAKWNSTGKAATYFTDIWFDTTDDAALFKLTWWEKSGGALEEIHETNKS